MIIPQFHASVPTGLVFSNQVYLSGFPSVLADQLWGSGILAQEQTLFFLAGMGHREGTAARMKSCFLCLLQSSKQPYTQCCCTTLTVADIAGLRSGAALLAEHLSFCTHAILYMVGGASTESRAPPSG